MNIVIVDDDTLVSLSLKTILEVNSDITVLATGSSAAEAERLYAEHKPDVLLMDIQMGEHTGLEAGTNILAEYPDARILLLTTFSDDEYIMKAIRMGAKGYILKQHFESIAPALRAVYGGQTVFGEEIIDRIPSLFTKETRVDTEKLGLSEKEADIVRLVADGLNNKEIAEKLYLGEGTVRNYISTILEKLQLRDRTQLAVYYYKKMQ